MFRVFTCLMALLLIADSALAEQNFESAEDIEKWMDNYHINPQPQTLPPAIKYLSSSGVLDNNSAKPPVFGFLASAFQNYPDEKAGWIQNLDSLNEKHLDVIVYGLWFADLDNTQEWIDPILDKHPGLKEKLAHLLKTSPTPLLEIPLIQGPWVLDALWGGFFASGASPPVRRIISTLVWLDAKDSRRKMLIGGAAKWSLQSNARQHPKVMKICEEELKVQPKEIADHLRDIIESAKKQK